MAVEEDDHGGAVLEVVRYFNDTGLEPPPNREPMMVPTCSAGLWTATY